MCMYPVSAVVLSTPAFSFRLLTHALQLHVPHPFNAIASSKHTLQHCKTHFNLWTALFPYFIMLCLVNFILISRISASFRFVCFNHSNLEVKLYRHAIFLPLHPSSAPGHLWGREHEKCKRREQWYTLLVALMFGPVYLCVIYTCWPYPALIKGCHHMSIVTWDWQNLAELFKVRSVWANCTLI